MKAVVSVRLSSERLAQIDTAARRLGMTRSQAIDAALRIFPDLLSGNFELKFEPQKDFRSGGGDARAK
jgi:hypothetical protein